MAEGSCCWGFTDCDCWKTGCGDCHDCHCLKADCPTCRESRAILEKYGLLED